ncbi:hypothetical protein C9426_09445 [Serratia sp. S1B]|nr:hypothetical protein C9426_09445 [Serratia sp. S1B]
MQPIHCCGSAITKRFIAFPPRESELPSGSVKDHDFSVIPFLLQTAWVLAALCHPSHIVGYAPRASIAGCLQAIRNILGILSIFYAIKGKGR